MAKARTDTVILDSKAIHSKVKRMAYEIFENFYEEKTLFLLGVANQGYLLAQLLHEELKKVHPIDYQIGSIELDKKEPLRKDISISISSNQPLKDKCVILVDDVLNSGKTLAYAMAPLLNEGPKRLQVCVLINRDHNVFPVSPSYVGLSLGTTLEEHVEVNLGTKGKETAFLH